jgi:hypothetical protein
MRLIRLDIEYTRVGATTTFSTILICKFLEELRSEGMFMSFNHLGKAESIQLFHGCDFGLSDADSTDHHKL